MPAILITYLKQFTCDQRKDKDNIIAMATEIFGPMQQQGLKVFFRFGVHFEPLKFLGLKIFNF